MSAIPRRTTDGFLMAAFGCGGDGVGDGGGDALGDALGGALGGALGDSDGAVDGDALGDSDGPADGDALIQHRGGLECSRSPDQEQQAFLPRCALRRGRRCQRPEPRRQPRERGKRGGWGVETC